METAVDLKYTPLLNQHAKLGAKMAPFAGWYMPIQYEGIIAEHNHTRSAASVFDICHMGEFYVKGEAIDTGFENILSFSVKDMPVGKCRYGAMLNAKGGVADDLITYRMAKDEWMIVVNAGTIDKDFSHIKAHLKDACVENRSSALGKIDLQGPLAREVISTLISPDIAGLKYYTFGHFDILGEKSIISRTGYTGELGYELYIGAGKIPELWKLLLSDKRVKPAGLGARDTLRLEMGYTLYGQDVDDSTTPLDAGLEKFINFDREFIGKPALLEQIKNGIKKSLVGFRTESRKAPRHGNRIEKNGKDLGVVTSGSFSPSLSCGIGLGYINAAYSGIGEEIVVKNGGTEIKAIICGKPFYKCGTARN